MGTMGPWIVKAAMDWLAKDCRETVANGGECVDSIQKQFAYYSPQNDTWKREAYCAKLSYVIAATAAVVATGENWLPANALAAGMLSDARRDGRFPVDTQPTPGSVFYRRSTAAGASGHNGVVVGVDSNYFYSVEGNVSLGQGAEGIRDFRIPHSDIPKRGFQFMHVERAPAQRVWTGPLPNYGPPTGTSVITVSNSSIAFPLLLLTGIGTYIYIKS